MDRRSSNADATGRVLGVVGILVAAGVAVFLYLDNQDLKQRIAALETAAKQPQDDADIVAKVRQPTKAEMKHLTKGKTLISFFNPAGNEGVRKRLSSPHGEHRGIT